MVKGHFKQNNCKDESNDILLLYDCVKLGFCITGTFMSSYLSHGYYVIPHGVM